MRFERVLGGPVASFLFPGYGHAMVGRRWAALAWSLLALATVPLTLVTVWMLWAGLALRIVAALDALRLLRRDAERATWWGVWPVLALIVGGAAGLVSEVALTGSRIPSASMYPALHVGDQIYIDRLSYRFRAPRRGEVIVFRYPCDPSRDYVKRIVALAGDTVEVRCGVVHVGGQPVPSTLVAATDRYDDFDESSGQWFPHEVSRYRETLGSHVYDTFHDVDLPTRTASAATRTQGEPRDFPRRDFPFPPSCGSGGFYDRRPAMAQPQGKLVETRPAGGPACAPQLHFVVPAGAVFVLGDNRDNANDSRIFGAVPLTAIVGRAIGVWSSSGEHGWDIHRIGDLP